MHSFYFYTEVVSMDNQLPPQQPPITPTPSSSVSKIRPTIFLAAILIGLLIVTIYLFGLKGGEKPEVPIGGQKISPTPIQSGPTSSLRRVEVLPKEINYQRGTSTMDLMGKTLVTTDGTIEKVLKEGESYLILLSQKDRITATLDSKTLIGDAWFEIENGVVVRSSYNLISKDKLIGVLPGRKVTVSYDQSKLNSKGNVVLSEFVLLD